MFCYQWHIPKLVCELDSLLNDYVTNFTFNYTSLFRYTLKLDSACVLISPGTYAITVSPGYAECMGGTYSNISGSTECSDCLSGTHSDSLTRSISCLDCGEMTWSNSSASGCTSCTTDGLSCDPKTGGATLW